MELTGSDYQICWIAPNGTQWICGINLWPWLPSGWIGKCTLGFSWTQGVIHNKLEVTLANLPLMWARWVKQSVFHWDDHLAAILLPPVGLEDVIAHIEALTAFTQQVLNESNQVVSLLNSGVSMMTKEVLQNRMAPDILAASQGGTCAKIQTERCVFIPDESSNITHLMNHMKNQISSLGDPLPSLDDLLKCWFAQWGTITCQSGWLLSKSLQTINAGEGVEKREPSYSVGGNAN